MSIRSDATRAILQKHAAPVLTALSGLGWLLLSFMGAAACPEFAVFASFMQPVGTLLLVAALYESLKIIVCDKGVHVTAYEAFAVPILGSVWLGLQSVFVLIAAAGPLDPEVVMVFIVIGGIAAFVLGNIVVLFGMARRGGGAAGLVGALFTILVIPASASALQFARLALR